MKTRRLGKTGYEVSEIGLGCWQMGGGFGGMSVETATSILDEAVKQGVNFWDTADGYGDGMSESRIGAYLPKATNTFVATKLGRGGGIYPDGINKTSVREKTEGSLKRLGVEIIDLMQLHCIPPAMLEDGEVFEWMEDLKRDGLIRHWGASVENSDEGLACVRHPGCASLQIIFNIFRQDAITKLFPDAQAADVGIIVRLPLASGLLSGKFGKGHQFAKEDHRNFNRDGEFFNVGETFSGLPFDKGVELVEQLEAMKPEGMSMVDLALRWILDQQAVSSIIAGVSRPDQLAGNAAASDLPPLSAELHAQLSDFYQDDVRPHVRGSI